MTTASLSVGGLSIKGKSRSYQLRMHYSSSQTTDRVSVRRDLSIQNQVLVEVLKNHRVISVYGDQLILDRHRLFTEPGLLGKIIKDMAQKGEPLTFRPRDVKRDKLNTIVGRLAERSAEVFPLRNPELTPQIIAMIEAANRSDQDAFLSLIRQKDDESQAARLTLVELLEEIGSGLDAPLKRSARLANKTLQVRAGGMNHWPITIASIFAQVALMVGVLMPGPLPPDFAAKFVVNLFWTALALRTIIQRDYYLRRGETFLDDFRSRLAAASPLEDVFCLLNQPSLKDAV